MNDHAKAMCLVGQTFRELLDDDVPTDDDPLLVDSDVEINSDAEDPGMGYLSPDVEENDD